VDLFHIVLLVFLVLLAFATVLVVKGKWREKRIAAHLRPYLQDLLPSDDPKANRIRQLVLENVAAYWDAIRHPRLEDVLDLLFNWGRNPVEVIYLFEYDSCDPKRRRCTGRVVRRWVQDERGLRVLRPEEEVNPGETKGRYWQRQMTAMYILPDREGVLLNRLEGPNEKGRLLYYLFDGSWGLTIGEPPLEKTVLHLLDVTRSREADPSWHPW